MCPKPIGSYDSLDDRELYDDMLSVMSSTECTGLIPSAPADESELDSYSQIYDIPFSSDPGRANHHLQDASRRSKKQS